MFLSCRFIDSEKTRPALHLLCLVLVKLTNMWALVRLRRNLRLTSSWTPLLLVSLLPSLMAIMMAGSRKKGFLPCKIKPNNWLKDKSANAYKTENRYRRKNTLECNSYSDKVWHIHVTALSFCWKRNFIITKQKCSAYSQSLTSILLPAPPRNPSWPRHVTLVKWNWSSAAFTTPHQPCGISSEATGLRKTTRQPAFSQQTLSTASPHCRGQSEPVLPWTHWSSAQTPLHTYAAGHRHRLQQLCWWYSWQPAINPGSQADALHINL